MFGIVIQTILDWVLCYHRIPTEIETLSEIISLFNEQHKLKIGLKLDSLLKIFKIFGIQNISRNLWLFLKFAFKQIYFRSNFVS